MEMYEITAIVIGHSSYVIVGFSVIRVFRSVVMWNRVGLFVMLLGHNGDNQSDEDDDLQIADTFNKICTNNFETEKFEYLHI